MRVLWVIPGIDATAGGPSTTAVNAVLAEARSGIEVTFAFTASDSGARALRPTLDLLQAEGVRTMLFPRTTDKEWAGAWGISFAMFRWLARNTKRYDVVNIQYIWSATTLVGSLSAKLNGVPVVLTAHESLTNYDIDFTSQSRAKRRAKLMMRAIVLRCVNLVAFNSDLERSDSYVPPGTETTVIAHAVIEASELAKRTMVKSDHFILGYLGRLHPKKNVEMIIEAVATLDERFRLIVGGSGDPEYEEQLHALADTSGIGSRVEWRGQISGKGRNDYLRELHLLLMPSQYESFGMVAAESMAVGVPVVTSPNVGITTIIEDFKAGYVMPDLSAQALSEAVEQLALDPELLERMSDAGLTAVERTLTFESYSMNVSKLYSRVT